MSKTQFISTRQSPLQFMNDLTASDKALAMALVQHIVLTVAEQSEFQDWSNIWFGRHGQTVKRLAREQMVGRAKKGKASPK